MVASPIAICHGATVRVKLGQAEVSGIWSDCPFTSLLTVVSFVLGYSGRYCEVLVSAPSPIGLSFFVSGANTALVRSGIHRVLKCGTVGQAPRKIVFFFCKRIPKGRARSYFYRDFFISCGS